MMNFNEFVNDVTNKVAERLGKEMKTQTAHKNNREVTGITYKECEENIVPIVYLDDVYNLYKEKEDMEYIINNVVDIFNNAKTPDISIDNMFEDKSKIVLQLINTEANKEELDSLPHREFFDMSIIYRFVVSKSIEGLQTVKINNDVMKTMGITEEELFELAKENTKVMLSSVIHNFGNIIGPMLGLDSSDVDEANKMMIITNNENTWGATNIIYDSVLEEVAEELGGDYYILPSSIHEVLAVPAKGMEDRQDEFVSMVREINLSSVAVQDRLSNQVFMYNAEGKYLVRVSDGEQLSVA